MASRSYPHVKGCELKSNKVGHEVTMNISNDINSRKTISF